jgi:uncharacterized membrane protein
MADQRKYPAYVGNGGLILAAAVPIAVVAGAVSSAIIRGVLLVASLLLILLGMYVMLSRWARDKDSRS